MRFHKIGKPNAVNVLKRQKRKKKPKNITSQLNFRWKNNRKKKKKKEKKGKIEQQQLHEKTQGEVSSNIGFVLFCFL